jgi:hypothetical protein
MKVEVQMQTKFAIEVLRKEYAKNPTLDMSQMKDDLQFLMAITVVERALNNGTLKESDYINQVKGYEVAVDLPEMPANEKFPVGEVMFWSVTFAMLFFILLQIGIEGIAKR